MHRYLLQFCFLLVNGIGTDPALMQRMAASFGNFQDLTERWFLPKDTPQNRKKYLKKAFKEIKPVLKFLAEVDEFPPGLDPVTLASKVIGLRQGPQHIEMAIPLLMAVLEKMKMGKGTIRVQCRRDVQELRRSCQDLFALLCHSLHLLEVSGRRPLLRAFNSTQCVAEYNAARPPERQFVDAAHCHRQLPGVTARPWWHEDPYPALTRIRTRWETIQEEVLKVVNSPAFDAWDPLKNDPTLTTNENWDPRASWDAIPFFFENEWNASTCKLFPITCEVLKSERGDLQNLCDTRRHTKLVPEIVRNTQDYDEVPTLGIKLYRVWPGAGLKEHTGSPGRIVNSIALHAPANNTITVAGETRAWVSGVMHHFDDAFYHSVQNAHVSEFRIVLAIFTWHPDLINATLDEPAAARRQGEL